jgi:type IV fimbrial biogenesis protein FimT
MPVPPPALRLPRGVRAFTLIEAATVLALAGVIATFAWPPLRSLLDRWHLEGTAATLADDLQFARFEAVVRSEPVRFTVLPDGAQGTCYVVHTGPVSACSCAARCTPEAQWLRQVDLPARSRVTLTAHTPSLTFDPQLGTCTPTGTLELASPSGAAVHQVVNVMGRVRSCSPGAKVAGHVAC